MQQRKISLNEFIGAPREEIASPPRRVSLRFIGKIEVLKPLTDEVLTPVRPRQALENREPAVGYDFIRFFRMGYSWFHQSFAAGSLAIITLVFLSAIFVGIYDRTAEFELGRVDATGDPIDVVIDPFGRHMEDLFTFDLSTPQIDLVERHIPRLVTSSRSTRQRVRPAAYRPPRRQPLRPRLVVAEFVPTTLIIYPENGEIKRRIEPQLVALHKIPTTIPNQPRR
ncbi:MAG TPA: hypothetical protein VFZ23_14865 [Pyrinomonadaceae bacterium]